GEVGPAPRDRRRRRLSAAGATGRWASATGSAATTRRRGRCGRPDNGAVTVPAERLAEAVAAAGPVLVDVGCGDGRHTVRWAERRPDALVVGLDAETTRLDRSGAVARKRKLAVVFVTAVAEHPPEPLR